MSKTILVTGASGFIATHTIIQLLQKGYAVRGTVRNLARADKLKTMLAKHAPVDQLSFVQADLMDADSWQKAMPGCDGVMHIASPIDTALPKNPDDMIVPAKKGTQNVLQAMLDHGVSRVVITSSVASIIYGHGDQAPALYTEEHHTNPNHPEASPYIQSKTYAEALAWDMAKASGGKLHVTTIHPSLVLGPVLEEDYGSSAEAIKKLMDGSFPGTPNIGFPLVDVRDVASMHLMAFEQDVAIGQRYICSGDFMWLPEVASFLREEYSGYKIPKRKLPSWLVRLFANVNKEVKSVLQDLDTERKVSWEKGTRDLGWQPRETVEAIRATAASLIEHKVV